jgi:hypothetical protein
MWYTWSGAEHEEERPHDSSRDSINSLKARPTKLNYFAALLDPINNLHDVSLGILHPPGTVVALLWRLYLENVHPLTMIFFDWQISDIIKRTSLDQSRLTPAEQSLMFAICFIAIQSLQDKQCADLLHDQKSKLLEKYQKAVEDSLVVAEFLATNDCLVLQALMLYLVSAHHVSIECFGQLLMFLKLVMRDRARPAAVHSLMGIASRIAERVGLQRDGSELGLPVLLSEERRRVWWQLQHMEVDMGRLIGTINMAIYTDWTTKLPRNLEDCDLHLNAQALPPARRGLTTISHCLWRYQILEMQRNRWQLHGTKEALSWMLSPRVPLSQKDTMIDDCEKALGEQFLQHCEPLNPRHVHIQIGVRSFVLAARRMARQPALKNVKVSDMLPNEREEFLGISTKCLEYYVLSKVTEALSGFWWHMENYFPWPACKYHTGALSTFRLLTHHSRVCHSRSTPSF